MTAPPVTLFVKVGVAWTFVSVLGALAVVREKAGEAIANALFIENPRAVVEARRLPYDPEPRATEPKRGLLGRVTQFFNQRKL